MEPVTKKRFPTFRYLYLNPEEFDGVVADSLSADAIPENGGLLIGRTDGPPVVASLQAGAGIGITNGPGTITIRNLHTANETLQAFSDETTTTSSLTDVVVDSMVLTPTGPGGYVVSFHGVFLQDTDNQISYFSIYRDGLVVPESIVPLAIKKDLEHSVYTQAFIPAGYATSSIDMRCRVTGGIGTFKSRNLLALERSS